MITKFLAKGVARLGAPVLKNTSRSFCLKVDFDERDQQEMEEYNKQFMFDDYYLKLMDSWRIPLEKKKRRQERIAEIRKNLVAPEEQEAKFVVHNPNLPLELPVRPENQFAIVELYGTQHKVKKRLMVVDGRGQAESEQNGWVRSERPSGLRECEHDRDYSVHFVGQADGPKCEGN
jgi:hypothetical protein